MLVPDYIFGCGVDSASLARISYSLSNSFYFARFASLSNSISDLRGFKIGFTSTTYKMECSSMRAQTSSVVYFNIRSSITSKLLLYIATFGASPTSTLTLEYRKYYSTFGSFGGSDIWSLIKKTSAGAMQMFFSGSDVMPLFATQK